MLDDVYGRLKVFGILDAACQPKLLRTDLLDQLARAIHERYLAGCRERGETPAKSASMQPWRSLPADLRASNYGQARHIGEKLRRIGCTVVPRTAHSAGFGYLPGEVLMLAEMEHERWMAEKHGQGMVYGPSRDEVHHPDLVKWDKLPEASRAKDIDFVENMPALLADAGFEILRVEPTSDSATHPVHNGAENGRR